MDYVKIIHTSAVDACKLLENLLEWSRAQTGRIDFKPEATNIWSFIPEICNLCKNLAKTKNITISYTIPEDIIVQADQNMLNTIIRNLITNAIKFTHKGGKIHITAKQVDSVVEISVNDTGIGMDEETKGKLFKINEKISIQGTEQETGTGLGLLLCKEFVEKHNGKIWAESELGMGSSFKFIIPLEIN